MILAFMQFPPDQDGYGGSQRAWYLAEALSHLGPVHFVFLHSPSDSRFESYDPSGLRPLAASVTTIEVPEWERATHFFRPRRFAALADFLRMGSPDAPLISRQGLRKVAQQLPVKDVDTVFAFRIPMCTIADGLLDAGLVKAKFTIVDFDDVVSNFRLGERATAAGREPYWKRLGSSLQLASLRKSERKLAKKWGAVSLCSDEDVEAVREAAGVGSKVLKVPNVIDRPALSYSESTDCRLLFVGNLTYKPNVHGLQKFLDDAWPSIRVGQPRARLDVVGLNPSDELQDKITRAGGHLHANVPSVIPYYASADIVIAPIFFGSGTRIKIIEAMAMGRAVVSTSLGAEGLDLTPGINSVIADDMEGFADGVLTLARNPVYRANMAKAARGFQQERYGPAAMQKALRHMFEVARS